MRRLPSLWGRWRSAPAAIFAIAVLILVGGIAVIIQNETNYRASRNAQMLVQAEVLAASVAAPLDFNDPLAAQEAVDAFRANRQVRWIGVYSRDGTAVATYQRSGHAAPLREGAMQPPTAGAVRVSTPVATSGQRIGTVYVELDAEAISRRVVRYVVLGSLFLLAALVLAALAMAQAALRKANRELSERAEALAQSNALLEEQMEERAKAEDQLRQSQKMQALGQLTGGIAHDFNNLLTVIQGSADMLCRDNLPDQKRIRFAQAIVHAADNAASLTSQLLAFARRQPLKPERLSINALISEMDDLIDRTMGERIAVVTDLCATSCGVEVDRAQLQSAILNIASNARDAMSNGGTLTIRSRETADGDGRKMIALSISDTGSGMDEETLDRVFEPFFTTKGTGKGTGLGLSQVYGFASQSGGEVNATSIPGKGTTFTLLLPCVDGDASARPASGAAAVQSLPAASILVVEDNEEVGTFAETLLSELGHQVTRASSGEEALELCRTRDFDIVFSDVVMPGMGGLKLAEVLAEERPELPVVLATGYSRELAQSGRGDRPVILKPYRLSTLSEALAEAMRSRQSAN